MNSFVGYKTLLRFSRIHPLGVRINGSGEEFDENKPQHCRNSLLRILDDVSRNKSEHFSFQMF